MHQNKELELAHNFVELTHKNIYLTGKAGTGKTTFLQNIKKTTHKRSIVVAPTGVAAINAGGVTIHSFFQLPFGPILPGQLYSSEKKLKNQPKIQKFSKKKINMIRSLDLLIIDEISMVRADLLDGIDQVLRRFRNPNQVFGGIQVLMIGDLQQLAPVVKHDEWELIKQYYDTAFFFSSKSFKESEAVGIELKHIYRQENKTFIDILNQIRNNSLTSENLNLLNQQYQKDFSPESEEGYITLTTHNNRALSMNEVSLKKLKTNNKVFKAIIDGDFPEYNYPNAEELELKIGAQVMFIKNDSSGDKRYFNGKIGRVTAMGINAVSIKCPGDDDEIWAERESWHHIKYSLDKNNEIKEEIVGTYTQIPLRLAWAITIHKSQGLTFDKAIIDAESSFAHGQTYVALSRCRNLEGIVLKTPIKNQSIIQDTRVVTFSNNVENHQPDSNDLNNSKKEYQLYLLNELFDFQKLDYHLYRCQRIHYNSGGSLMGNLDQPLKKMKQQGTESLKNISSSFLAQLKSMSEGSFELEKMQTIQDRIKKAIAYYLDFSKENLITPLDEITYTSDNKTILKDFREELEALRTELSQKMFCLKACENGFYTHDYLKARAQSIFENIKPETPKTIKETSSESLGEHPLLFKKLKQYRHQQAEKRNIKHFQVFSQKSLFELCEKLPTNIYSLSEIHGIGKKKIETYGEDIIDIVQQYCIDIGKEFETQVINTDEPEEPKQNTRDISFKMFKEGLSLAEIAEKRSLTENTVLSHLLDKMDEEDIKFEDLIEQKKLTEIENSVRNLHFDSLSDLYRKLNKKYSYSELKVVLKKLSN